MRWFVASFPFTLLKIIAGKYLKNFYFHPLRSLFICSLSLIPSFVVFLKSSPLLQPSDGRFSSNHWYLDIYHARPDEDDPSYVVYDEEEFNNAPANKSHRDEVEMQPIRPAFRGPPKGPPAFGPPPRTVSDY